MNNKTHEQIWEEYKKRLADIDTVEELENIRHGQIVHSKNQIDYIFDRKSTVTIFGKIEPSFVFYTTMLGKDIYEINVAEDYININGNRLKLNTGYFKEREILPSEGAYYETRKQDLIKTGIMEKF